MTGRESGFASAAATTAIGDAIDWSRGNGLVPAIVQHAGTGAVLMLGYMNAEALARTQENGRVTFWSRSRGTLWTKGETSGHWLALVDIALDCDADALLVRALPAGPVCHRGTPTCFDVAGKAPASDPATDPLAVLKALDQLIATRERDRPAGSYTTGLFDAGIRRIAQKVGEEAVETALAAVAQDDAALLDEAADLVYHLLVLLRARGQGMTDVARVLAARHRA